MWPLPEWRMTDHIRSDQWDSNEIEADRCGPAAHRAADKTVARVKWLNFNHFHAVFSLSSD